MQSEQEHSESADLSKDESSPDLESISTDWTPHADDSKI